MPEPGPERRDDPYTVGPADAGPKPAAADGTKPTATGTGPRSPQRGREPARRPADPGAVRRVQLLVAFSAAAAVSAVVLPLAGLGLGMATLLLAWVRRRDVALAGLGRFSRAVPIIGGVFAVFTGGLISLAMLVIGDEIDDYQGCRAGANTNTAQQRCQDEFIDTIEKRFGSG